MRERVGAFGAVLIAVCLLMGCGNPALQRGDEALNRQDFEGAISAYRTVLASEPENVAVRYRLVDAHVKRINVSRSLGPLPLPELEAAVKEVHEIIAPVQESEPDLRAALVQLHFSLARNYDDAAMPEQARNEWRTIASLQPGAEAQYNIGHASTLLGDWEGAVEAFQQAIAMDEFLVDAYKGLGNSYIQLLKDADAVTAYQRALEIEPLDSGTRFNLGVALQRTGEVDAAIVEYQKVIEQDPTYSLPYRGMRNALERKGDREGATEWDRRWREVAGLPLPEPAASGEGENAAAAPTGSTAADASEVEAS